MDSGLADLVTEQQRIGDVDLEGESSGVPSPGLRDGGWFGEFRYSFFSFHSRLLRATSEDS